MWGDHADISRVRLCEERIFFESRGKIEAKGKGEMEMWFVRLKKK